jgi:hypothetical protein
MFHYSKDGTLSGGLQLNNSYYTTNMSIILYFVWIKCPYQVAVSTVDQKYGDTGTQAAAATNQRAASCHQACGLTNSGRKLVEHTTW